jgi:hypothetical protein
MDTAGIMAPCPWTFLLFSPIPLLHVLAATTCMFLSLMRGSTSFP